MLLHDQRWKVLYLFSYEKYETYQYLEAYLIGKRRENVVKNAFFEILQWYFAKFGPVSWQAS